MKVETGKTVQMHYVGKLEDGTIFDSSENREPLSFVFGEGSIIPALETELEGMEEGQKKTVKVKADDAYGQRDPNAIQSVPRSQLPENIEPKVGMQLLAQMQNGNIPVTIVEVDEENVVIDFNHPLAGKDLIFDVEIVKVS
ncbi:FKBP-type peptidyl-prolyl cis-trans isomerase [Hippea maritima]|uniref:Peptidyl-prolyl cis-trans isomerase n=1 Tax=Hippea maritima (strain ATCC 700847 / DSM 10411 / MH2) TaxID=760142 RepID=F2LVY5_HIPMA|nr:peptidylprolyl isomerase [Hippea maritima]AEA33919.1 peptidylprolyl isomerase FKBP-type [Hippea maritima DSM 10411]